MGITKKAKQNALYADAQRAYADGRKVFVARYWDEVVAYQGTGAVAGADVAIEWVEYAGWKLEHMSYSWVPEKSRGVGVYVFRRGEATPTA